MNTMAVFVAIGTFVVGCFAPAITKKVAGWAIGKLTLIK